VGTKDKRAHKSHKATTAKRRSWLVVEIRGAVSLGERADLQALFCVRIRQLLFQVRGGVGAGLTLQLGLEAQRGAEIHYYVLKESVDFRKVNCPSAI
jgi:hypothetical protein